jgi:hypothetical protein
MDARKVIAAVGINLAVFGALAFGPVSADGTVSAGFEDRDEAKYGYGYLPGWGYGDVDREHSGPPGLVRDDEPLGTEDSAEGDDDHDNDRGRSGDAPGRQQDDDDDEPGRSGDAPGRGKNKD